MIQYLKCFKQNYLVQKIVYLKRTASSSLVTGIFINYPYRFGGINISPINQPTINEFANHFFLNQGNPIDKIYLQTLEAMSNKKEAQLQKRFNRKLLKQFQQNVFLLNKNSKVDVFYQSLSFLLGYSEDQSFNLQQQNHGNIIKFSINKSSQTQQNFKLLVAFDVVFKSRAKLALYKDQNDKQEYHHLILGKVVKLDFNLMFSLMNQLLMNGISQKHQLIPEIKKILYNNIVKSGNQFKVENMDSFLK